MRKKKKQILPRSKGSIHEARNIEQFGIHTFGSIQNYMLALCIVHIHTVEFIENEMSIPSGIRYFCIFSGI